MFESMPKFVIIILSLLVFLGLVRFVILNPLLWFAKGRANRALDIENYNRESDYSLPGFAPIHNEVTQEEVVIEGTLPDDLDGIYLRNGTNSPFDDSGSRVHMFNGAGMIHQVHIHDGKVSYSNRYTKTLRYEAEKEAGCELYIEFGDVAGGGKPAMAKIIVTLLQQRLGFIPAIHNLKDSGSSTAIQYHHGKLYALQDNKFPFALNASMKNGQFFLDGTGEYEDFEGRLTAPYTAHPQVDPETGEWFSFSVDNTKTKKIHYDVLSQGELRQHEEIAVIDPAPAFLHDCNLTENHVIVPDLSVKLNVAGLKEEHQSVLQFDPDYKMRFGVIKRNFKTGDQVQWFTTAAAGHIWHTINSWEEQRSDGGTDIVLFAPVFRAYGPTAPIHSSKEAEAPAQLHKFRFNLESGEVTEERRLLEHFYERPSLNTKYIGKPSRYAYLIDEGNSGGIMGKGVLKYDLIDEKEAGYFDYGDYRGGEALFVESENSKDEDDGYLLDLLMTEDKACLVVIDAKTMEEKARLHLPQRVPYGVHACWINPEQKAALVS